MEPHKVKIIAEVLKNDRDAVKFVMDIAGISRIWDDLYDQDRKVDPYDLNLAFWRALVEIPSNPFYVQYQYQLIPLLREYINNWMDANEFERGDHHQKTLAFVLRDSLGGLLAQCAYILGGYDWMRQMSPKIRAVQFEESFEQYLEDLENGIV